MIDPLILARSVHLAATVLAAGTVAFILLVSDPAVLAAVPAGYSLLRRRLVRLIWIALAAAIASGVAWLLLVAAKILTVPVVDVWRQDGVWTVLTDTRFGEVAIVRLALAGALGALLHWPRTRLLQLAAAAALIALLALVGHAGATPGTAGAVHLASDMVHLLGAGAWLGSLPGLVLLLARAAAREDPAWRDFTTTATRRYSALGVVSVAALLASGLINSWNLLAGPGDLIATDYGRLLALKIGLFAAMVAIAAVNRYRLTPNLPAATRALRRNSLVETGLGLCVLFLAGALGTMVPGGHVHNSSAVIPDDAAFTHIHTSEVMAEVTIDPGRAGKSTASIRVMREDLSDFPAKEVTLALDPPAPGRQTIESKAVSKPDGTWRVGNLEIPVSGVWTVRVIINSGTGAPIVLDAPIEITQCSNDC